MQRLPGCALQASVRSWLQPGCLACVQAASILTRNRREASSSRSLSFLAAPSIPTLPARRSYAISSSTPIASPSSSLKVSSKHHPTSKAANKKLRQDRSSVVRPAAQPDGQAIAFSVAQAFNIDLLTKCLAHKGLIGRGDGTDAVNLLGEAIWIPRWPTISHNGERQGEIFVFETGSYVTWGVTEKDALDFRNCILRAPEWPGIEVDGHTVEMDKDDWTERMPYFLQAGEQTGVKNDLIVINANKSEEVDELGIDDQASSHASSSAEPLLTPIEVPFLRNTSLSEASSNSSVVAPSLSLQALPSSDDDLRARLALSSGLARSTKLSVYEEMLDSYMERVEHIPALLMRGSSRPLKRKIIIADTARFLQLRQYLNLDEENLLDPPDMFWAHSGFEKCYDEMIHALEVKTRLVNLNQKLDYNLDMQDALRDLENSQNSHRLEWIIIVLIAVEVVLGLAREGYWPFDAHMAPALPSALSAPAVQQPITVDNTSKRQV